MTHRFPIKEIAAQAGMSTATVDRALNGRAHVSQQTKARVAAAIEELEGQEAQLSARGRRMFVDVVAEAPRRFTTEIRRAIEAELPALAPAVLRPRFEFHERMTEAKTVEILRRIGMRGSHGVCLKARDLPGIRKAIDALADKGIPVVTVFTDIPDTRRLAYAGLDNANAGRTAAYLIAQMRQEPLGQVLMTKSDDNFHGEAERAAAFVEELGKRCPDLTIVDASGGAGLARSTAERMSAILTRGQDIRAVYSMGGGNAAILDTLEALRIRPEVFIAHDLDADNLSLLRAEKISVVLHHDLRADMRAAAQAIMGHHRLLAGGGALQISDVGVITPLNLPRSLNQ